MSGESVNIQQLESEIDQLAKQLQEKKDLLATIKSREAKKNENIRTAAVDISRYSRQIILPFVGLKGQEKLKNSSVLIVGVGGLGCPAALYLASAGIGHLGLVDYDDVEVHNLHRQILHTEEDLGMPKIHSASSKLKKLDNQIKISTYKTQLTSGNAISIISQYDVILDATDNVATRYLLNDACILTKKPLVSGSALWTEGQLTVYNYMSSPCYRCLFPKPPPPDTVNNCSSSGVLGPVCGVIGVLQAMEAIKVILNLEGTLAGTMLLFDAYDITFSRVKLRKKTLTCDVCGIAPNIKTLIDYEQFCGSAATDRTLSLSLLGKDERITVDELFKLRSNKEPHLLIDVRSNPEFEMCHLSNSLNVHIGTLEDKAEYVIEKVKNLKQTIEDPKVIFICRRGNDSQVAVNMLKTKLNVKSVYDVEGGLHAWATKIDQKFPIY